MLTVYSTEALESKILCHLITGNNNALDLRRNPEEIP